MTSRKQNVNSILGGTLRAGIIAIASLAVFMMCIGWPQATQAQTLTVLHSFSASQNGAGRLRTFRGRHLRPARQNLWHHVLRRRSRRRRGLPPGPRR